MSWEIIIIVFIASFLVRIVSVSTGGGGLILIPLLTFLGLPPSAAIATNRTSTLSINLTLIKFHQHKQVKWKLGFYLIIPTIIGSLLGTLVVVYIDQELFKKIIGLLLLVALPLLLSKNKIGMKEFVLTQKRMYIGLPLAFIAGFLGGLFASTGIWFTYLYLFLGLTFVQQAGTRKISGMALALISIPILIYAGLVDWPIAIAMFIGSGLGAWIGAKIGIKLGNVWIRRGFALVVIASAIKLIFT